MALLNPSIKQPIGVKTLSPQDNIKTSSNILPSKLTASLPSNNFGLIGSLISNIGNSLGYQQGKGLFNPSAQQASSSPQNYPGVKTTPTLPIKENTAGTGNIAINNGKYIPQTNKVATTLPDLNKLHQDKVNAVNAQLKSAQDSIKTSQEAPPPSLNTASINTPYAPQYNQSNVPTPGSIASQEANIINNPNPSVQQAQKELVDLKNEYAQKGINIENTAGSLTQATGLEGQLQRQYLIALDAAQVKLQNALTEQGQGITALGQAGQHVAPISQSPGTSTYLPGSNTYNPTLAGTQGGTGGLQSIGNIGGQIQVGGDIAQQNAILGSAQATGEALQSLITQNSINPSGFTPLNGLLQVAGKYTSNTAYQEFAGQVNDFVSKIAPILGGPNGATTDYKTQLAGQIVNSWASGNSINDVISYFLAQAKKNIQGYSGGGGAPVGSSSGGNTFGSFFGQ